MISLGCSLDRWSFAGFAAVFLKYVAVSTVACTVRFATACAYPFTLVVFTLNIPSQDGRGNSTPLWPPVFFKAPPGFRKAIARAPRVLGVCTAADTLADTLDLQDSIPGTAASQSLWAAGLRPLFSNIPLNCERKTSHV